MILKKLFLASCTLISTLAYAQVSGDVNKIYSPENKELQRKEIIIPNIGEYKVLKGDFHIHTMFSDGLVWPTYRIEEAWSDGLDVISITDHIEYRPHKDYVSDDLNVSYKIALPRAKELDLLLIKGTEITRKQGVLGHFNALFIEDANKINISDPEESIKEAKNQGAYIILNHPGWALDSCVITPFQQKVIDDNFIDGIEVINNHEYYPLALSWCLDKKFTIISASDSHTPIIESYNFIEDNRMSPIFRPMTLIFVNENDYSNAMKLSATQKDSLRFKYIREALDKRMTLGYFNGNLAGSNELLGNFVRSTLYISKDFSDDKFTFYRFDNKCDFQYVLEINNKIYRINPMSSISIKIPKGQLNLDVRFLNLHNYTEQNYCVNMQLQ